MRGDKGSREEWKFDGHEWEKSLRGGRTRARYESARQGKEYECRKLSILRISLVNRAFEFRSWRRAREGNAATDSTDSGSLMEPREIRRSERGKEGTA